MSSASTPRPTYAGQIMIADLVAEKSNSADDVLSPRRNQGCHLGQYRVLCAGAVNKLRNGDIVSVIVYDKETNQSHVPPELRYVKVITTTTGIRWTATGKPTQHRRSRSQCCLSRSGKVLAYLNTTTTLHFSLVCRGDKTVAEQYLKVQEDYLASHSSETTSQEDTNG